MSHRRHSWAVAGVLLLYVAWGMVYSVVVPVFEAPDESHHFFVVKHIVEYRALPVQRAETRGLWSQEGSQPPLYYLVGALLVGGMDLSDAEALLWRNPQANIGDPANPGNKNVYVHPPEQDYPWRGTVRAVHVLRFYSLVLGAVAVIVVWHTVRLFLPERTGLPLVAAGTAAFIPQFTFITASVNNDNAMTCLSALALYLMLRLLREGASSERGVRPAQWSGLGVVLGLALLSKLSALALLALTGIVIFSAAWYRRSWRVVWTAGLAVGLPVIALAGWWYVRNVVLYGEPTGLTAMWEVVGQRSDFGQDLWGEFRGLRYSFWGLFGWFSIPLPGWVYRSLDVFSCLAVLGVCVQVGRWLSIGQWRGAWSAWRYREPGWGAAYRPMAFGLMALWAGLVFVSLVRWTSLTHGTQGRLLFPAVGSLSLFFILGLRAWFLPRVQRMASMVFLVAMCVLGIATPWLWVAPVFARPSRIAQLPQGAIPLELVYGGTIALRGVGFEQQFVRPGEALAVHLYWRSVEPVADGRDVLVWLRLIDPLGTFVGVEDSYPGSGTFPVSLWPADQLIGGRQYIRAGSDVDAPLIARLDIGLYDAESGEQLAYPGDDLPTIGRIKVVPRRWPRVGRKQVLAQLDAGAGSSITLAMAEWSDSVRPGKALPVQLVWVVQSPPRRDYTVFVHLEDGAGNVYGYGDGAPREGRYPTWIWEEGEVIRDEHHVLVEALTPAGHYHIRVGLYDSGGRVPAYRAGGTRWLDDAVDLGTVEVR